MGKSSILESILNLVGRIEGKTLEAELNEVRKSYTPEELNEAMIVEKQHVAGFKYNDVIDEVIWYIRRYLHNEPYSEQKDGGGGWWNFEIPSQITRKFDFVSDLVIKVEIEDFEGDDKAANDFGGGETYTKSYEGLVGNTLNGGQFLIRGISYNRTLSDYSIRNNLYHELTHEYENYKRRENLQKIGEKNSMNSVLRFHNEIIADIDSSGDDNATKVFSFIYYRLFNQSELSAAASSTYAYLKSIKGQRREMLRDLKKTQAYDEYDWMKKQIEALKGVWDEEWWRNKMRIFWKHGVSDPREFKSWFLSHAKDYLKKYFHAMTSAAALYYDETEKKPYISDVISTKGPTITELKKIKL